MGSKRILALAIIISLFHFTTPRARGLRLKLIPANSPDSPLYPGNITPLEEHQKYIEYSQQISTIDHFPLNRTQKLDEIPIQTKHLGNYRHAVNVKIGSPGKMVTLLVDTGSGFVWTQCVQKSSYQPMNSRSYKKMPCNHLLCVKGLCSCNRKNNQCECPVRYGSNQVKYSLKGSIDTFHFPGPSHGPDKSFHNVVFGCSDKQPLDNLSGLLGLDRTPFSVLVQLKRQTRGKFSYCLSNKGSYLTLGDDVAHGLDKGKEVRTTPLIHTEYSTLFLNLTGISVGGTRLGLSPTLFSLKNGGVFMDTGMKYTVLAKNVYDKYRKAFESHLKGKLKRVHRVIMNLSPCYNVTRGFTNFPVTIFHFQGGADFVAAYTVAFVDDGIVCLAMVRGGRTIIGALQQWNTRLMFDVGANVLKFYGDDCRRGASR